MLNVRGGPGYVSIIPFCTFSMLRCFDVALFSYCTLFMLQSFHVALFSCCTLFMLQSFHVVFFSCCLLFMLRSFHVALFLCCTFLILKNIENERKAENATKKMALHAAPRTYFTLILISYNTFLSLYSFQ